MKLRLNNYIIVIIVIITGAAGYCPAQEPDYRDFFEAKNLVSISSGLSLRSVRDEMMSPLIYSGTQIPLTLSYKYIGFKNRHTLSLYFDKSELNSSVTDKIKGAHYIKNLNLYLRYTFAIRAFDIKEINASSFLGIRFSSSLNLRNHYFLTDKQQSSAEQMTGLGLCFMTESFLPEGSKNHLNAEINIPFLSYAILSDRFNANVSNKFDRLDYEKNVFWQLFTNGDIVTFNKLFEIQAELSYFYHISKKTGLNLSYCFHYYSFAQYEALFRSKALNNQFLIGLTVQL